MANEEVVFITNIPAPYREFVHQNCYNLLSGNYTVIYCSRIESNRSWNFNYGIYSKLFLECNFLKISGRTIYLSSNIVQHLKKVNPQTLIIGGFSFPMIVSYLWALKNKRKIISFTDANVDSESKLSVFHKLIRKIFYRLSNACIGASVKSLNLYKRYGIEEANLFQSHLCANNEMYTNINKPFHSRDFDVLLCGQMIPGKMFDFSIDVIELLIKEKPNLKVKVLGSGPDKEKIINRLNSIGVYYDYPGFLEQSELPKHYANCKIFFFPSMKDAWGVVANESCAAGTPVLTCPLVGAANELILNHYNGFVMETNVNEWFQSARLILNDEKLWSEMSKNAVLSIEKYTYRNAAIGIVDAVFYVKDLK